MLPVVFATEVGCRKGLIEQYNSGTSWTVEGGGSVIKYGVRAYLAVYC